MINSLLLWTKFVATRISMRMAYRGEYLTSIITMLVFEMFGPLFAFIVYYNTPGFPGWTLYQLLFLQGILILVKGTSFVTFFGIVWNSNILLEKGDFDMILTKPRNTLFLFICNSFDAEDTGKILGGLIITTYALLNIPNIHASSLIIALFSILIGFLFFLSMALFFSSFIFRYLRSFRVYELLDIITMLGQYPKSIYPKAFGALFTFVIPIFVAAAFPAQALLTSIPKDIFISTVATLILCSLGLYTWFHTIKRYASAGG